MATPVYIDESLAKGLASRFLREAEDRVNRFEKDIRSINFDNSTKKGWLKKFRQLANRTSLVAFGFHELGTKSKPAIAFMGIVPERHEFKTWEERCLTGTVLIFQFDSDAAPDPEPIPFVISHHALTRVFMRCEALKAIVENWNYEKILNVLRPLPAWSAFWSAAIEGHEFQYRKRLNEDPDAYELTPVIPSEYGLFFCHTSRQDPRINLRTFVGNDQLRSDQKELRETLLRAYQGLTSTPMALHPWTYFWGIWHTELYIFLLTERLASKREQITKFLYSDIAPEKVAVFEELGLLKARLDPNFDFRNYEPNLFYDDVVKGLNSKRAANHNTEKLTI